MTRRRISAGMQTTLLVVALVALWGVLDSMLTPEVNDDPLLIELASPKDTDLARELAAKYFPEVE